MTGEAGFTKSEDDDYDCDYEDPPASDFGAARRVHPWVKLQAPKSNLQRNTKPKAPTMRAAVLVIGIWIFSGACPWSLEFLG